VEAALDQFWECIANKFPAATTGDLSPLTSIRLSDAAQKAVQEWIAANVQTGIVSVEHTPGPWFVDRESPHAPLCIKPYPGRVVCDVEGADPESIANARLIAAAPELLAACEGMCNLMYRDKHGTEQIDLEQYEKSQAACRRAIAKAREATASQTGQQAV
jgi:hypothetical protein